jgi:hypothetical protein
MFGKYEKLVQLRLCQLLRMKKCHFFFSHHRNDVVFTHSQQKCSLCRRSHRPGTLSLSSPNICPQHPILETLQSAFLPQYKGPTLQFVQRNADFVSFACFKLYISKQQMLIQQTFRPVAANILQTESVLILYVHGVLNYDFTKNFSHATFSNIYVWHTHTHARTHTHTHTHTYILQHYYADLLMVNNQAYGLYIMQQNLVLNGTWAWWKIYFSEALESRWAKLQIPVLKWTYL